VSNASRITYTPRPDATPESELSALATVYKFILNRYAQKKAADPSGGDDYRKGLLNPEELEQLQCPSPPRVWESEMPSFEVGDARKMRGPKVNAIQPRLPRI
jgi:hypothetical protein